VDAPAVRKFSGFGLVTSSAGCLCCHKIYGRYVNANGNEQQEYHHIDACRRYQRNFGGDEDDDLCENCHHYNEADHEDPTDLVERFLPLALAAIVHEYLASRTDRLRTRAETLGTAREWRDATSTAARKRIVHTLGITWSSLYLLPYFDPTTMVGIDALHHLWHGIVQALILFWLDEGILSNADIVRIQAIIQATPTPYDIGAMHTKLLDRFARMSAADQMQFVLVYSDTLFAHFLDGVHLVVWRALSRAARLLSQTSFTPSELVEAELASFEYNRILSETYEGRAFAAKTHELTHCARTIRQGGPGHVHVRGFEWKGTGYSAQHPPYPTLHHAALDSSPHSHCRCTHVHGIPAPATEGVALR
jgi:hypothetical protein